MAGLHHVMETIINDDYLWFMVGSHHVDGEALPSVRPSTNRVKLWRGVLPFVCPRQGGIGCDLGCVVLCIKDTVQHTD